MRGQRVLERESSSAGISGMGSGPGNIELLGKA